MTFFERQTYLVLSISVNDGVTVFGMCRRRTLRLSRTFALFLHPGAAVGVDLVADAVRTAHGKSVFGALKKRSLKL